jgi:carbonic anhydrase/acetyltransferase-like protein (isoleucine patch superfamily)
VGDDVLIGIRATILDGAVVGSGSIVGAGAVVTEGTIIAPGSLVLGIPAEVVGRVAADQQERIRRAAAHYVQAAGEYQRELS